MVSVPAPLAPVSSLVREIVTRTVHELSRTAHAGAQHNGAAAVRADAVRARARTGARSAFDAISRAAAVVQDRPEDRR
jgi:hypothetical protein